MASPDRTIDTPQFPEPYFKPLYKAPVGVTTSQSVNGKLLRLSSITSLISLSA